jgi:hypothetical protein
VLSEYKPLLVKMGQDLHTSAPAKDNFEALVDVEVLLAFHCLVPMLEIVNRIIKWAHDRDVYIVDFILGVKNYTSLLYRHFPAVPPLRGSIHTLPGGHLQVLHSAAGGVSSGDPHKVANVCWLQGGALGV